MTVFKIIEKRQKSCLLPSGFWQKSSLQNQKSTFTVKFSAFSSLGVTFFVIIRFPGQATAFCAFPRFSTSHDCIACWEIARLFDSVRFSPYCFHIYTKSTATPTYQGNFYLVLYISVVANSKICCGRSRNSSVVESQRYFVLERPFFRFHEQQAKFANKIHHLTCFFDKVDS